MSGEEPDHRFDPRAVARDVEACAASHRALDDHLASLAGVDPTSPSLLPGWSIGQVLTHIARNGDSHVNMLAGDPQYPSSERRDADIDAGSTRPWDELIADVRHAGAAVDEAYATFERWGGTAATLGGGRPTQLLPLLRQREVEIHRIDLGLGYEFADLPSDYVRRDSRVLQMLWTARQPMGLTRLPTAVLARSPHERLGWLLGRTVIDGAAPAAIF